MARVITKDGSTPVDVETKAWLTKKHPFPRLTDPSLIGRLAFLGEHEDVLWAFWSEAFSIAYSEGTLRPSVALGVTWSGSDADAGSAVAEKLVDALRSRATLPAAPSWIRLEAWHAWLVGGKATRARKTTDIELDDEEHPLSLTSADATETLLDLKQLLERWSCVLRSLVVRTSVRAIELDWLWATCRARAALADALPEGSRYARLADVDFRRCVARSSAPGDLGADRIRRSRAGACAAFRFNLEELATRAGEMAITLAPARDVFVGPAGAESPHYPTQRTLGAGVLDGCKAALRRSKELSLPSPDDGHVEVLWREVFACGLNKSALRLLPKGVREDLERELDPMMPDGSSDTFGGVDAK
jgi:hypothetical protein